MHKWVMHKWVLAGALVVAAAAMQEPAQAAAGVGVIAPAASAVPSVQAQPIYWTWHGRHWNHRRWAPRIRVAGRWVPGHYSYY